MPKSNVAATKKSIASHTALNQWLKNANSSNTLGQLLRDYSSKCAKLVCSARVLESIRNATTTEGPIVKVVLITEGLGNRNNMHYYGPEAIVSGAAVFEGASCFLNHPGEIESRDIPERRVEDKCGYFKNVQSLVIEGTKSLVGELHFDLSESGRLGYQKALTALHYRQEFPGLNEEYVGLSINADGDVEQRRMNVEGESLDVNYVKRFTGAFSCDIVTFPARGGRFLALVESAAGAKQRKEGLKMKNKKLEEALTAAQTALEEAAKETDPTKKIAKFEEGQKLFNTFLVEAKAEADASTETALESEADKAEAARVAKEADDKAKKEKKKDGENDEEKDEDAVESKRLAIKSLAKESGVEIPDEKLDQLQSMTLAEAKKEVSILKKMQESIVRKVVSQTGVSAASFSSMSEAERKEAGQGNNTLFECAR